MTDWIDFSRWNECLSMVRPGYVFEIVNDADQHLWSECQPKLEFPWDWVDPPTRFRLVPELPPSHSAPLPKPKNP